MAMTSVGGAAFFDLDRTLLAGASGEVFSKAMREAGLVSRSIPGESLLYRVFNTVGETLPSMALARQAVTLAKGRSRQTVQQAAQHAAEALAAMVQPLAAPLFDEHRRAGRPVVLATTTPYDLVKPLADRLGLDAVVATRYGVNADGTYDGTIAGPFVWSAGKLAAVREWATANGVDLSQSFAYSDSVYDTPLLSAVGNPFVVNPDPRMVLMAAARRWPTIDLSSRAADAAAGHALLGDMARIPVINMELQRLALSFVHPLLFPYARFEITGTEPFRPRAPPSWWGTTAAISTRWPSPWPSLAPIAPFDFWARRKCSMLRWWGRSRRPWAVSASIAARAAMRHCRPLSRRSSAATWWR
jgi:putative phosphoserine phosphatase/1-acylglycerol-3-phosphate O-acyltransferase